MIFKTIILFIMTCKLCFAVDNNINTIDRLPSSQTRYYITTNEDTDLHVCSYLPIEDLFNLSLTSKTLKKMIEEKSEHILGELSKFGISFSDLGKYVSFFKMERSHFKQLRALEGASPLAQCMMNLHYGLKGTSLSAARIDQMVLKYESCHKTLVECMALDDNALSAIRFVSMEYDQFLTDAVINWINSHVDYTYIIDFKDHHEIYHFNNPLKHYDLKINHIAVVGNITSIGYGAFEGCRSLKSVTIPEGVKTIGSYAFYGCASLKSITIHEGVKTIGSYAFYGCASLQSVTIPEGMETIDNGAFIGCTSLQSITIHEGVKMIGNDAFYGCTSLKSITIHEGVKYIDNYVFKHCTSLESITIPEGVKTIGDYAFSYCSALTIVYCSKETFEQFKHHLPSRTVREDIPVNA